MQDLRSMATGSSGNGRMFSSGGERSMRPHPPQALKCPRCDSLNTKFCYYNNYNLSQPRHFCKSCRRYWTNGGVLRNVPVGGSCRKTKRSSKPKPETLQRPDPKSASHSSSDGSTLTAAAVGATAAEVASASSASRNFGNPPPENFNRPSNPAIFPETGSFTNLMTASNPAILGFNFADPEANATLPFQFQQQQQKMLSMVEEMKMQELTAAFMDQTVPVELPDLENRGGLTAFDWHSNNDQRLFDLTGGVAVDHGYWNHGQWPENDQTLYLP